jgi:hypothetical protein
MTVVQINGQRFDVNTAWAVDEVQLAFSLVDGGPYAWQIVAHDPSGPNSGNVTPGTTVLTWTDTVIELDFDGNTVDPLLARVLIRDVTDVEQLEFDVTPDAPVLAVPVIEDYSYVDYYDTQSAPPAFQSMGCGIVATGNAVPAIFFYTQNVGPANSDGVRLTVDGSPVDYRVSTDPQFFGDGQIYDGYFLFADPALAGTQITDAQPLDLAGVPMGTPTSLVLNYNTATSIGIQTGNPDTLEIDWAICHDQPTQVEVTGCSPAVYAQYYDPLGPNAGLNPGGATIVQWDTSAIIVEHPGVLDTGDLNLITTRDQYGRTLIVLGDPLPTV